MPAAHPIAYGVTFLQFGQRKKAWARAADKQGGKSPALHRIGVLLVSSFRYLYATLLPKILRAVHNVKLVHFSMIKAHFSIVPLLVNWGFFSHFWPLPFFFFFLLFPQSSVQHQPAPHHSNSLPYSVHQHSSVYSLINRLVESNNAY